MKEYLLLLFKCIHANGYWTMMSQMPTFYKKAEKGKNVKIFRVIHSRPLATSQPLDAHRNLHVGDGFCACDSVTPRRGRMVSVGTSSPLMVIMIQKWWIQHYSRIHAEGRKTRGDRRRRRSQLSCIDGNGKESTCNSSSSSSNGNISPSPFSLSWWWRLSDAKLAG